MLEYGKYYNAKPAPLSLMMLIMITFLASLVKGKRLYSGMDKQAASYDAPYHNESAGELGNRPYQRHTKRQPKGKP